jgi:hypothetical protein
MRIGPTGTPSTWSESRPASRCRHEQRLAGHSHRRRLAGRALRQRARRGRGYASNLETFALGARRWVLLSRVPAPSAKSGGDAVPATTGRPHRGL